VPWTGKSFASKHNHSLKGKAATKAAKIATAMVNRGVPEGEAIATANKRANTAGKSARHRSGKTKSWNG
jgi:uncharacterized protein YdaT